MKGTELERELEAARVCLDQAVENAGDMQEVLAISRQLDELIARYMEKGAPLAEENGNKKE